MGELTFFLGLQVKRKRDGAFISQDKYVAEILKKFGFTEVSTASTPMETQKPLLKNKDGEEVDVHMYRSMIGSLMYLTSSRPDIMFAVCACARYQVNSKVSHLDTMKRICSSGLLLRPKLSNGEVQLHAKVNGKKIIVTELFVRRDLRLAVEEGIDCLPNSTIFEQLALMGDSQMHNNIMAAGLRDRPPMLATGRYPQWRSRFLRYIDTRPNGEALRKCILSGPYKPITVLVQAMAATDDSPAIPEHTTVETPMNMSPASKAHLKQKKKQSI
nr:hypothetical protein [Tanacetum cinerariifolium]